MRYATVALLFALAGARAADKRAKANQPAGRLVWYENRRPGQARAPMWLTHEISRRRQGMFDKFWPRDMDGDGDIDFVTTRGNSSHRRQPRSAAPVARRRQALACLMSEWGIHDWFRHSP